MPALDSASAYTDRKQGKQRDGAFERLGGPRRQPLSRGAGEENGNLGGKNADSFHSDRHKDLKADFILANLPFNMGDWGGDRLKEDSRWQYGIPPKGNANYAMPGCSISSLTSPLAVPSGIAGFVLANGFDEF